MKHIKLTTLVLFATLVACAISAYSQPKTPRSIKPTPLNRAGVTQRTAHIYNLALSRSAAKKALNTRFIYTEEVQRASQMYQQIDRLNSLTPFFKQLRKDIQENIVNHTLRTNLLRHLDQDNKKAMLNDLSDYYHLLPKYIPTFHASTDPAETFAWDALGYLRRNPHKPNWALRQVLKTPGVDELLKEEIRDMLKQDTLSLQGTDYMINLLRLAYQQYSQTLADMLHDPSVQETLSIYKQLTDEMEIFTNVHNRAPRWENEDERDLYNRFETLLYQNQANWFEPVIPYLEKLYMFAEEFALPRLDEATTLRDAERFLQKFGELPRSVRLRDFINQRPQEALLYEAMLYWKAHSPAFQDKISNLTTTQTEDPFPPEYYY